MSILDPMLGMLVWSGVVVALLMSTRLPVIVKQWGRLQYAKHSEEVRPKMSDRLRYVTDNYNHLFEQPTLFYATLVYIHLAGTANDANVSLAWAYVVMRVIHSLIQLIGNNVSWRAASFATSSAILIMMIIMELLKVVSG